MSSQAVPVPPVVGKPLAGVSVLVLTSGHEALDGRVYAREATSLSRLGAAVTVIGKHTRGVPGPVPVVPIQPVSSRLARFLVQPWRCLWAARRFEPDIIHFHDAEMLAVLPVARLRWPRAKFVYDVHEDFANLLLIRDWLPAGLRPLAHALTDACERMLVRLAHGVVAVTPPLMTKFSFVPGTVAYNYATAPFFDQARKQARRPSERDFELVHLGTLSRRRAAFLAEVLRDYHARRPAARSMIVGAEPDVLAEAAGSLPAGCEVLGKVPFDQVPALLGNAKIGIDVHPWLTPHLFPALAVKVCEYMASGCAVVASSMPVLDAILEQSGLKDDAIFRIEGGEPGDYAEAAARLVEGIEAGRDPGATLRDFAQANMVWDGEAAKIAQFYNRLLERN